MLEIKNEDLCAVFCEKGAELIGLKDMKTREERLWDANPQIWAKRSPILFPIIGALKGGQYVHKGRAFAMNRHGFARDSVFNCIAHTPSSIAFQLVDTSETQEIYPFHFKFTLTYQLSGPSLEVKYAVENPSSEALLFNVGGHPAFNCKYTQYPSYIEFEKDESPLLSTGVDLATGLLTNDCLDVPILDRKLTLSPSLFKGDTLIFQTLRSSWVQLVGGSYKKAIRVGVDSCDTLALWSPHSDFVCIEPWWGIPDKVDATGALFDKSGIISLPGFKTWQNTFTISV